MNNKQKEETNMLELKGKYGDAKVFTDNIDQETISQVIGLLNQPYAAESRSGSCRTVMQAADV